MEKVDLIRARAVPLRADNVDTDQIIPARYLTAITTDGMGEGLFASWRYLDTGEPNPEFVLNNPEYKGAEILVAGANFGSGSSREHAVWALVQYGFKCVLAPSFGDIFYNNSLKNGFLPVVLPKEAIDALWDVLEGDPATQLWVDLRTQNVRMPDQQSLRFEIDPFRRDCLLQGLDDLGFLLAKEDQIAAFEAGRAQPAAA